MSKTMAQRRMKDVMYNLRRLKKEAESRGFTVDTSCWPWVAYKGPRFAPEDSFQIGEFV